MRLTASAFILFQFQLSLGYVAVSNDLARIVNGVNAPSGKYTSLVSLQEIGYHVCGASIVSANYVLTAAHCIDSSVPLTDLAVVSSVTNLDNKGRKKYQVTKTITHQAYNASDLLINDIALIKVSPPFSLTNGESLAQLPEKNKMMPTGTTASAVGWGKTKDSGRTSKILKQADMKVLNFLDCSHQIGKIHSSQFCVTSARSGICEGDSGGPIYADGKLIGLASWRDGTKPCGKGVGVYTQVSLYLDWIDANME